MLFFSLIINILLDYNLKIYLLTHFNHIKPYNILPLLFFMSIFNLFKKKPSVISEPETIKLTNFPNWILNKKQQHKEKEKEFLNPIKDRIAQLISQLKEEMTILEEVDIEAKKSDTRIKLVVKEGRKNYIIFLQKLIERLENIKGREKIIEKINFAFDDFKKRSNLSYEKTTFLIGKEMKATKESIAKFFKDLEKTLKINSNYLEEFEVINLVEEELGKLNSLEKNKTEIESLLFEDKNKLEKLKQESEDKEKEITTLKQSDKFKNEEDKRTELEIKKQQLDRTTSNLKEQINFKALTSFYHKFENEMKLIKGYKENFKQTLKDFKTEKLLDLLREAKLDSKKITELAEEINNKRQQISGIFIETFDIENLEREIERTKTEITLIELGKESKQKRLEVSKQDLDKALKEIRTTLEKINVNLG